MGATKPSEMSVVFRVVTLAVHTFTCALTAGVIIGFGQLYPILVDAGVYHYMCPAGDPVSTVCTTQSVALVNMFTVGASISTFVQGPSGFVLDAFGPKITALVGLVLLVPGCFLFAFASPTFDAYLAGFVLMSAGGPWVFVSVMSSANLFMKRQAMLMMMFNGAYGCGAFVFFVFFVLFNTYGLSMRVLFIGYGVLCGLLSILVLVFWPMRKFEEELLPDSSDYYPNEELHKPETDARTRTVTEFLRDVLRDALTVHYIWLLLFVSVLVLGANFYLSTAYQQLQVIAPDATDTVNNFNTAFGVLLPALGFVGGTPLGLVIDVWGLQPGGILLVGMASVSFAFGMINNLPLQMVRYCIFSVYFPYIFGFWGTFIAKTWGFVNYGTLFGVIAIAAGAANFAATPLDAYTSTAGTYFWVNLGFLCGTFVFIVYPIARIFQDLFKTNRHDPEQGKLLVNPTGYR